MFANVQNDYTYYRERSFFDKESDREFRENNSAILKWQVGSYSNFLDRVAELARSKWTEFDLREMGAGLFTLLLSIIFHLFSVRGIKVHFLKHGLPYDQSGIFPIFAALVVVIRAFSALSNSYICKFSTDFLAGSQFYSQMISVLCDLSDRRESGCVFASYNWHFCCSFCFC